MHRQCCPHPAPLAACCGARHSPQAAVGMCVFELCVCMFAGAGTATLSSTAACCCARHRPQAIAGMTASNCVHHRGVDQVQGGGGVSGKGKQGAALKPAAAHFPRPPHLCAPHACCVFDHFHAAVFITQLLHLSRQLPPKHTLNTAPRCPPAAPLCTTRLLRS